MTTKVLDLAVAEALIEGTTTVACVKCGESNWSKAAPTKQTKKLGFLTVRCKTCANAASSVCLKERYATDEAWREAMKASKKERWATDEAYREAQKAYNKSRNKERRANDEAWREARNVYSLQWAKDNPGKANAITAKRRAAKKQATPPWSETDLIKAFYVNCPEGMHVDHIVPLTPPTDENGDEIGCGLHVLKNLQYLTAAENIAKSNKWPEDLVDWVYS